MQMTTEAQTKVAVQEVLAEKIMERLNKLAASEERELRGAFSKIPVRVYETALERLSIMKMIRKVQSRQDGLVFVAKTDATKEDLVKAARRFRDVEADSLVRAVPEVRRAIHAKNGTYRAQPHPLTDDAVTAEHDEFLAGSMSQEAHFGLNYESARFDATYEDAQLATRSATEPRQVLVRNARPMAADKRRLVEIQLKSGQGFRNAKRARRRYFAKPEKGLERRIHEHAQRVLAEEKARFNREA
ncbi:hypothetical protein GBA65_22180 (plasmid) [Rubrobacter marinus]|uniref:Uncharacterized protein n=1 Tax=Rubrobacter marinus TaxID=2653852 RepID=A0A6G8Q3R9_9ACTN|nr:hypothetical protein [Rubrobacter marinus]QIN81144.1 hypothetical protein GBA65_22180 [Rubrobacter marinus]